MQTAVTHKDAKYRKTSLETNQIKEYRMKLNNNRIIWNA